MDDELEIRDATALEDVLQELLAGGTYLPPLAIRRLETFADAGVLTTDRGLVLELRNGAAFQVTIVQSAAPC